MLHWVSALAVALQLSIGFPHLGGAAMATSPWLGVHLSLGLAILGLTIVRLLCRLANTAPHRVEPQSIIRLAALGRFSLYIFLTGWLGYRPSPFQIPTRLFGAYPMPVIAGPKPIAPRTMPTIHSLASWGVLALIGLHEGGRYIPWSSGMASFEAWPSAKEQRPRDHEQLAHGRFARARRNVATAIVSTAPILK